jgi:hypothetical protein
MRTGARVRIVIVDDHQIVRHGLRAKGYLKRTIRAVHRGHSVLDPKVASRVIAKAMAPGGKAYTIKDHLEKIGAALAVRSRTEIVAEPLRAGLI